MKQLSLESLYTQVYLIFPEGIKKREQLTYLYIDLINSIPVQFTLTLFVLNREQFVEKYSKNLTRDIKVIEEQFNDIWLADYFPFRRNEKEAYTFLYNAEEKDSKTLAPYLKNINVTKLPYALDIGALEMIGETLIVSEEIYNKSNNHDVINRALTQAMKLRDIVVLNPKTSLNHMDTMIRVFDQIVLYNPQYLNPYQLDQIKKSAGAKEFSFYPMSFKLSGSKSRDGDNVESYVGNPFDFLVLDKYVLFPISTKENKDHLKLLKEILEKENVNKIIIELDHPDLTTLFEMGGGPYCITGLF